MTAAEIAQLAIILAPLAQKIYHDGKQLIVEYKAEHTAEDLEKSLELSKSATWPKLSFAPAGDPEETQG
jgi:hypothetical protein